MDNVVILETAMERSAAPIFAANNSQAPAISVVSGDLNGDGKPDLVFKTSTSLSDVVEQQPGGSPQRCAQLFGRQRKHLIAPGSIGSIYGKALAKVTIALPEPLRQQVRRH